MRKNLYHTRRSARVRTAAAALLCAIGLSLVSIALSPTPPGKRGPVLANSKINFERPWLVAYKPQPLQPNAPANIAVLPPNTPTFGQPVIAGIGGLGFEESIRLDPTDPNRIYTSAPGTASADTSWIWHSLDGGKTFKWVVGAAPLEGKVTSCHGGGDTELLVDIAGHLYFNDLTLANFSTSRSDDFGASFTCSNTGVPDTAVDRQWYAVDGDPVNGGSLYLTNDEIGPGGVTCGTTPGNNVLVMYRSPAASGLGATAGITFGIANKITMVGSCDEGIMGNDEVSPIATTLGQPNTPALPAAVKHIYVIHDNATFNKILMGRCFPVAFGAPVANVSDPSGLNCTDLLVSDLNQGGGSYKTGGSFPTMAIDKGGNLYAVWEQAPIDANGNIIGDTVLKYSYSTDQGNTWLTPPIQIDASGSADGVLHNNVFAWIAAGDDGRVNIAWYGTPALSNPNDQTCGVNAPLPPAQGKNINGPDSVDGLWSLWMVQSTNAHAASPTFTVPVRASGHHVHRGSVQTVMGGQCGNRALGDFFQLRTGPQGEAHLSYVDSDHILGAAAGHAMYVRQNAGTGLYAASSPINTPGIAPFNGVSDVSGDGKYEVAGTSSANMPQLDILSSSVTKVTTTPCSVAAPCYKFVTVINNLSLAPSLAQDPDPDLVWSTQWFVPSTTHQYGGKNFHVYAESLNGAALQCFVGENALLSVSGGFVITYPGKTQLPAQNCQSTLGPNGNVTIYVPVATVADAGAIDDRLHEVTASTMTLQQPANSNPDTFGIGIGGSLFNLIDVAPAYTFDPNDLRITSITRLPNGHILLQCHGAPSRLNTVQSSPDLNTTPFYFLASVMADANGIFQYEDTNPPPNKGFYRLALP
jgi:hypothetical protein